MSTKPTTAKTGWDYICASARIVRDCQRLARGRWCLRWLFSLVALCCVTPRATRSGPCNTVTPSEI